MEYLYEEYEFFDSILRKIGGVLSLRDVRIAIYGTGNGGNKVYGYLDENNLTDNIVAFIDRSDSVRIGEKKFGKKIGRLTDFENKIDLLMVAAELSHKDIVRRIHKEIDSKDILVIDMFEKDCDIKDYKEYISYIDGLQYETSKEYIEMSGEKYIREPNDTKVIAWYLPQYYVTEYNNRFHGMGFTEWTNSSKTFPQFCGHYQPHIPYHVGYYDLSNYKSIKRQAEIARYYGIYGFAIHYYWFNENTRMLQTPIKLILENKDIDINYFINWATEDWSMEWDDSFKKWGFSDSYIKQELPKRIDLFIDELVPFFEDKRYIKINNMPVLSVYNCLIFTKSEFKECMNRLRLCAKKRGLPGLYIVITTGSGCFDEDVNEWGADALVEYQPNYMCGTNSLNRLYPKGYVNPHFNGKILDTREFFYKKKYFVNHGSKKYFRCAATAWDNTARKASSGARILWGITPEVFEKWLVDLMIESKKIHERDDDYIFVSSWNEWAEGSHLEPDMRYGYAWLNAVRHALEISKT